MRRCVLSLVIAMRETVRLIPRDVRALLPELFTKAVPSITVYDPLRRHEG